MGTETSDDVLSLTSDNEYVIKAKSARKLGRPKLDFINEHGRLPTSKKELPKMKRNKVKGLRGFAGGGLIDTLAARKAMLDDPEAAMTPPPAAAPAAPAPAQGSDIASTPEQDRAAAALASKYQKKGVWDTLRAKAGFKCGGMIKKAKGGAIKKGC